MTKSMKNARVTAIVTMWKDLHRIMIVSNFDKEQCISGIYENNTSMQIQDDIYNFLYREYQLATNEYYLNIRCINVRTKSDL